MSPSPPTRRFSPPPRRLDAETRWILARGFGPREVELSLPDPEAAKLAALRSGLASRIASRTPTERLEAELGAHAAALVEARRRAAQHFLAYEAVLESISDVARAQSREVVLLKGFALTAAGITDPGSRELGDLDILVDRDTVAEFSGGLATAGFQTSRGSRNEQHLPPMRAPAWGLVDLHDALRGVCGATSRWLGASDVLVEGRAVEVLPGCWVPDRRVLAAHALAHGLEQHATSPNAYPLLRTLGDLIDILGGEDGWRRALPPLRRLLRKTLREEEILAARELCLGLRSGNPPEDPESPAGSLLAHFMAHTFDADYRAGLRGLHRRHRILHALRQGTLLRYLHRKLSDRWRKREP